MAKSTDVPSPTSAYAKWLKMRFCVAWLVTITAHATVISLPQLRGSCPASRLALTLSLASQAKLTRILHRTYQMAKELELRRLLHIFRFSPRQGTAAARMHGQMDEVKKDAASRTELDLNDEHSRLFRQQFLAEQLKFSSSNTNMATGKVSLIIICASNWRISLIQHKTGNIVWLRRG